MLETTREARRGRSMLDRFAAGFPAVLHLGTRLVLALPSGRVRQAILEFGHRRAYAAYTRGDWELNTASFAPDYVFVSADDHPMVGLRGEYEGAAGYLDAQEALRSAWSRWGAQLLALVDLGGRRHVAVLEFGGTGATSGAPVRQTAATLCEFDERGRLRRHTYWWNLDAASEALGVDVRGALTTA